ncbi:MAG: recombinase RecT [Fastidiosipilaceae bacterium]|jgi:recombination protein RecT
MATAKKQNNNLAILRKDTVDVVATWVRKYQERGELQLPPNYSASNALKSAWLVLQETTNRNKQPVLQACTQNSIVNALLDMVVQGLNPGKKQCYFVAFGQQLVCMRSYFGSMAAVKNVAGATDVWAEVVYKGDVFEYEIKRGRKHVAKHTQKLENIKSESIAAAYAVIEFGDERPDYTEIMTIDQIKQAWKQGPNYREGGNGTHQKFTADMAKKTVINKACKGYINSSSDANLFKKHFNRAEDAIEDKRFEDEVAENANQEIIDVEYEVDSNGDTPEPEPGEADGNGMAEDADMPDDEAPPISAEDEGYIGDASVPGQMTIEGPGF